MGVFFMKIWPPIISPNNMLISPDYDGKNELYHPWGFDISLSAFINLFEIGESATQPQKWVKIGALLALFVRLSIKIVTILTVELMDF